MPASRRPHRRHQPGNAGADDDDALASARLRSAAGDELRYDGRAQRGQRRSAQKLAARFRVAGGDAAQRAHQRRSRQRLSSVFRRQRRGERRNVAELQEPGQQLQCKARFGIVEAHAEHVGGAVETVAQRVGMDAERGRGLAHVKPGARQAEHRASEAHAAALREQRRQPIVHERSACVGIARDDARNEDVVEGTRCPPIAIAEQRERLAVTAPRALRAAIRTALDGRQCGVVERGEQGSERDAVGKEQWNAIEDRRNQALRAVAL